MCRNEYWHCNTINSEQLMCHMLFILLNMFKTGWTFRFVTCPWRPWKSFLSLGFQSQKGITNPSQSHSCRFGPSAYTLAYTWLQRVLEWKRKHFYKVFMARMYSLRDKHVFFLILEAIWGKNEWMNEVNTEAFHL